MKLRLLGTGDATGTPKVGCSCPQCRHARENGLQRLRTSLLLEHRGSHILVDSGPDLRQQLLAAGSPHIDALLWTHGHYDHFIGFGEFYRVQDTPVVYAPPSVLEYCSGFFNFLPFHGRSVPAYKPFSVCGVECTFLEVPHPPAYTCGLLLCQGDLRIGYTADASPGFPEESLSLLEGVDLLLVDALVPSTFQIPKHMNYADARELARSLNVGDFRCVHMSHHLAWDLPFLGHDGETFCWN
jgi:phosphoribosyl 1,2-cyclic phosphate phosphodiesterase